MRAVIFDWGGTLTPWYPIDYLAAWRSYADHLHPNDPAMAATVARAIVDAEELHWSVARDRHKAFTIAQVLAAANAPMHDVGMAAYRTFWDPSTRTDPDVLPTAEALKAKGLRLGVLSSTPWPKEWHEEVLDRDGVLHLFDALVWSSDLEYTKPHAEAFLAAMRAVGVDDPADCVYVGDRLYDDVSGAKSVGMRAVFVPHSDIPPHQRVPVDVEPDAVIQRLTDLPEVLERWRNYA
ncbi:HAD family hydrolase [Actinophytocola oryzae]|uniref:Putative hydrolase of the HAD superfamily n=1 Tax=Actinophytocola oryzae TaxID=502181 RepID=A0A4V3FSE9_9PSEU|nr:HAD-IA family hydrolase [Actinophytocola oryzae]TDV47191.1 putative hydrolase of the HAD superfamily [Actinophytocola oryzae]